MVGPRSCSSPRFDRKLNSPRLEKETGTRTPRERVHVCSGLGTAVAGDSESTPFPLSGFRPLVSRRLSVGVYITSLLTCGEVARLSLIELAFVGQLVRRSLEK